MKIIRITFLFFALFLFFNCVGQSTNINPDSFIFTGEYFEEYSSIAVVRGNGNRTLKIFLGYVIEKLSQIEKINVISQSELTEKMEGFPYNLMQDDFSNKEELNSSFFSNRNMEIYFEVHDKLNTDYILVVWISKLSVYYTNIFGGTNISVCARLIKYPESIVTGYSYINRENNFVRGMDETEAINDGLERIAFELVENMSIKLLSQE